MCQHGEGDLTAAIFDPEGFTLVWCVAAAMPRAGRKCSPTARLFHLQELDGREGGFQRNIYSDLFLSLARGPWEKTAEDKQWTMGFRDEQWCQCSMHFYRDFGSHWVGRGASQHGSMASWMLTWIRAQLFQNKMGNLFCFLFTKDRNCSDQIKSCDVVYLSCAG